LKVFEKMGVGALAFDIEPKKETPSVGRGFLFGADYGALNPAFCRKLKLHYGKTSSLLQRQLAGGFSYCNSHEKENPVRRTRFDFMERITGL